MDYIKPELLILIPVMNLLGMAIKKIPYLHDWLIPIILGLISIFLSTFYVMIYSDVTSISEAVLVGIIQGILIAGTSVFANQIVKQTKNKGD